MLSTDKVLALDPLLAAIFLLLTVLCIIRLAFSIWVYHDASGHGRDAMGWMGLVSVLGFIGLIIWLVVRPKSRYPYAYHIPYYQMAPPGQVYQMQYQPSAEPYPPPDSAQAPATPPAREQMGPMTPEEPLGPTEPAPAKETELPQAAPSPRATQVGLEAPGAAAGPAGQLPPLPPGYVYASPWEHLRTPPFNPYSVRRMIATFVAAIAFANYTVTPIMMAWILQMPAVNPDTFLTDILTPEMTLLATAVQDGLLLYFTWLVMFRRKYLSLPGLGLKKDGRTVGLIVLGLVAGLALFSLNYAISWPIEQSGMAQGSQSIFDMRGRPWGLFLIGIATVGIAPFTEELFFRGYALATVERKWGAGPGILLSALMFAVVHLSIASLLPIFAMGVLLAMLCRRFGLIPCIMAHAVNNLLAVVLIYLGYG